MFKNHGFTLAEVLITLAIIGVVAALTIPSVVTNYQQQEFKTGLKKAVSVLNSAIAANIALEGETPYDNSDLFGYLTQRLSVTREVANMSDEYITARNDKYQWNNAGFYTTDGMRFEMRTGPSQVNNLPLYENNKVFLCTKALTKKYNLGGEDYEAGMCGGCGSFGLDDNPWGTTKPPCVIMVDVNGDRKPNPANVNCKEQSCAKIYQFADPSGKKLTDTFTIMVTDRKAIPYGVAAQKAMYGGK